MKSLKLATYVLFMIFLAASVSAAVDVTINANVNNFEIAFVDCLDAGCNQVQPFSGTLLEGTTTNDGSINVRFPDTLATPFGYVGYFVAKDMLPKAGIFTFHTDGNSGIAATSINIDFGKKTSCTATVDTFNIQNEVYANIPLVIQTNAGIAADTQSAFELTGIIGYIPPEFMQEYFSIDTRVTLEIRDVNGNLVETQTQDFTAANGNAIFASSTQPVEFIWTPQIEGQYQAEITTLVIDPQCESTVPASTGKPSFEVLPELPRNMCYTILNDLTVDKPSPAAGQEVTVSFNKITNYANDFPFTDPGYQLIPETTALTYEITDADGNTIAQAVTTLSANNDNFNPETYEFTFRPVEGENNINLLGNAAFCTAPENIQDQISLTLQASASAVYDIEFNILTENGIPLANAGITINNQEINTSSNGVAVFQTFLPGNYSYEVSLSGYNSVSGAVEVTNFNRVIFVTLNPTQAPGPESPVIANLPDVVTDEDIPVFQAFNLGDYSNDPDTPNTNLNYIIVTNTNPGVGVSIDNNNFINIQTAPNFNGVSDVVIEVTDGITTAQDTFTVTVNSIPDAPIIQNFNQQITTNLTTPVVIDLSLFEIDVDSSTDQLTWTVAVDANVVDIQANGKVITLIPVTLGTTQIDLTLTDETQLSDTASFTLIISQLVIPPQCDDGIDNDGDGLIDLADPGCVDVNDDDEADPVAFPACSDGVDNDGDGLIDLADPGCADAIDDDETDPVVLPACSDGVDNDGDGLIDLADPGCANSIDNDETEEPEQERIHLKMESIRLPNAYDLNPGETLSGIFRIENDGTEKLENVKVVVSIPELGIRSARGPVDVSSGGLFSKRVLLDIPDDVAPGYYPVRITIGNGEELRVKYREIFIKGSPVEEVLVNYCPEQNKWC